MMTKARLPMRLKELRSMYASYLRKHGLVSELVDLCQGRISSNVFVQSYLKENPENLSRQVLSIISQLEETIT
jgi:intergrase/recombinase